MNKLFVCVAGLAFATAVVPCVRFAASAVPDDPIVRADDDVMKLKLDHGQKVFCALARNELDVVASNAASLAALTRDARWRRSETPEYLARSVEFERTATTLADMANAKNSDGAALAWVQLTAQCLDCHRWLREGKKPRAQR
jgi:pyruvoyl-dependent arginine decarboxylase (PvlArgDC)